MRGESDGIRTNVVSDRPDGNDSGQPFRGVRTGHESVLQDGQRGEGVDHRAEVSILGRARQVFGIGASCFHRRGARPQWRLFAIVILGDWLSDLNPIHIADAAWNTLVKGAKSVSTDVINWVKSALATALSTIEQWARDALGDVESSLGQLFGAIQNLDTEVAAIGVKVGGAVESGASDIVHDAEQYADNAVAGLKSAVEAEITGAKDLISDATKDVTAVRSWVITNVFDPLDSWIKQSSQWFLGEVASWWKGTYNDIVKPILSDIETASKDALSATEWIANEGVNTAEIVAKCADWLAWFALNPIAGADAALEDLLNGVTVAALQSDVTPDPTIVSSITDAIAKVLT